MIDLTLYLKCFWTAHHLSTLLSILVATISSLGNNHQYCRQPSALCFPALPRPQLCSRLYSCSCPDFASCHPHCDFLHIKMLRSCF